MGIGRSGLYGWRRRLILAAASLASGAGVPAQAGDSAPSFLEDFATFDHGIDQVAPARPHRWRTVFGYGGAQAVSNRQITGTSFAADALFAGVGPGAGRPLGLDPFVHRPGMLTILGQRVPGPAEALVWNKPYFGGLITTRFSFSQRFGYFETEARLPTGKGMWPAFWLLPTAGFWPNAGEIDVFEGLGEPHVIHCTSIHGKAKDHFKVDLPFDVSADFHRYGLLWSPTKITWYVDRKPVASAPTPPAMQDTPMYILLDLGIGGSWGGYPDAQTVMPGRFVIRRVAAWPLERSPVSAG